MVRQFNGLLLGYVHLGVLLRIDAAPDAAAIAERARGAWEALMALYPVRRAASGRRSEGVPQARE